MMPEQPRIVMISDGGSDSTRRAAAACIVADAALQKKVKLLLILGDADNTQAEICGGLLGLSYLRLHYPLEAALALRWICDNKSVLEGATHYAEQWERNEWRNTSDTPVRNRGLWRAYRYLAGAASIEAKHVHTESGHRQQLACDRACCWAQEKGLRLLEESGEGPIGTVTKYTPEHAWRLVDGRHFLAALLTGTPGEAEFTALCRHLEALHVDPPSDNA